MPAPEGDPSPILIQFHDAATIILQAARETASRDRCGRAVVAICGPVGAGKSTLASAIGGTILSTDRYLPDYHLTAPGDRDLPESADLNLLQQHLRALRQGESIEAPVWSFKTHKREGYERLDPDATIVLEGIHALHASTFALIDIPVFIDAGSDIRWSRWELIERAGLRGMGVDNARRFFDQVAEPTFHARSSEYRARARFLVKNETGLPKF